MPPREPLRSRNPLVWDVPVFRKIALRHECGRRSARPGASSLHRGGREATWRERAGTGALLGGGLGWLAGIGALASPGLGPLIAAGPIMAALTGAAVGGTVGGLSGALIGMGIPEYEAKHYEGKVKGGHALISVHSENSDETDRAKAIFEAAGVEDVATSSEPSESHKR